jgi:hypothetical protein
VPPPPPHLFSAMCIQRVLYFWVIQCSRPYAGELRPALGPRLSHYCSAGLFAIRLMF